MTQTQAGQSEKMTSCRDSRSQFQAPALDELASWVQLAEAPRVGGLAAGLARAFGESGCGHQHGQVLGDGGPVGVADGEIHPAELMYTRSLTRH
jgi:hypothetical protein